VEDTRQVLTGCLLDVASGEVRMFALDGYRLTMRTARISDVGMKLSAIVPGKSLSELGKLLSDEEEADGYHAKFNTAVILRADLKTQIEALSLAVNSFLYTPNEAREFLDKPAIEGGDQLLGNGASIPVQLAGTQYTQNTAGKEEDKAWMIAAITAAVKAAIPA
jgi:hypothetical protein